MLLADECDVAVEAYGCESIHMREFRSALTEIVPNAPQQFADFELPGKRATYILFRDMGDAHPLANIAEEEAADACCHPEGNNTDRVINGTDEETL